MLDGIDSTGSPVSSTNLTSWLAKQPMLLDSEWLSGLEERKREEAEFHDADRKGHRDESPASSPNRRFYQAATVIEDHIDRWLRQRAPGGIFLDYACGNGKMALAAARAGAETVVGIDISPVSVHNAAENLQEAGFGNRSWFLQRDCENTGLPANAFTACLCSGMLHHLDLANAFPELHRVMAPEGRILCVEALSYNPVIQWYRNRTPELRTDWEKDHILGMREVRFAKRWFRVENLKFHMMAAPVAALLPAGPLRRVGIEAGHGLDAVLTRVPGLRYWSWMFSFELVKSK